jgi:hypothetical protein
MIISLISNRPVWRLRQRAGVRVYTAKLKLWRQRPRVGIAPRGVNCATLCSTRAAVLINQRILGSKFRPH